MRDEENVTVQDEFFVLGILRVAVQDEFFVWSLRVQDSST